MNDDSHKTSSALVEKASQGDLGAIETLLGRFLPDLRRFLQRRAGPVILEHESGSDLVQSVCREVLERLADERLEYQGEAQFKQWLYRAAELKLKNRHRFYHRDRRDPGREEGPVHDSLGEKLHQSLSSPSDRAARQEEIERLEHAFDALEPSARRIITLFHIDGLAHREIAERLGVTESHSRTLLARAMARLARLASS